MPVYQGGRRITTVRGAMCLQINKEKALKNKTLIMSEK